MKDSTAIFNELIQIARDGARFYSEAASKVRYRAMKNQFNEMAALHKRLISDLSDHIIIEGDSPSAEGTLVGSFRKLYTELLAALSIDSEAVYIDQLEEMEACMRKHYLQAIENAPSEEIRSILSHQLPFIEAAHNRMRALQAFKKVA